MADPIPGTLIIGRGVRRRLRMTERVRELLGSDTHLDTRQLTVALFELAERFDALEELVLADPDGLPVDEAEFWDHLRRSYRLARQDLVRSEVEEHAEELKAQQHAWTCPRCGKSTVADVCPTKGCGFNPGASLP